MCLKVHRGFGSADGICDDRPMGAWRLVLGVMVLGCSPAAGRAAGATAGAGAAAAAAGACVGEAELPAEGLRRVEDPALLAQALGRADEGKLCAGAVYEVTAPLTVYRVWQADRGYTALGRWWTFARPSGTREAYRAAYAICPEWSALDRVNRCEVPAGTRLVVGVGQSARCESGAVLPRSASTQVFIDNDTRQSRVLVTGCETAGAFP